MGNQSSLNININSDNISLIDMKLTKLPIETIFETKVKYLYLSGNKFNSLPENLKELILIDLSNNQMGPLVPPNVSKALTSYANLKTLYLSNNQLQNFNDIFESNSVETLDLLQNRFTEFPERFFEKLPNLKILYFDCNFLKVFPKQRSNSISSLSMSLNSIETIDLSGIVFTQLASLDLSKNKIKRIPKDFSKSFPLLHDLNLNNNIISELPEINQNDPDSFVFPKSLKEINLSFNLLEKIANSITLLPNLTYLNVQNNKIKNVPQLPQSLQKLNLSNNKINSIAEQSLGIVKEFDISYNELTKFPTEIKMPQCSSFIIDHNKISTMNFDQVPFKKVLPKSITNLDISFNKIEKIPKEIFTKLPNLQTFVAYFNKISEIPPEISNCKKLSNLDISFNPIKKLPKLPRSLLRLLASNCQLDTFNDPFVEPSPVTETADPTENSNKPQQPQNSIVLKTVDLSMNNLESFPEIPTIQTLNLSQNNIKKLPAVSAQTRILDVSMNQLDSSSASMPDVICGTSLVEVNLSQNKLNKFPRFQSVPLLQYLELSGNQIKGTIDISGNMFLERIDVSQTGIESIIGVGEVMNEVITSQNDFPIQTKPKIDRKGKNKPSPLTRPIYINQESNEKGFKSGYSEFLGTRSSMEDSIILRDDLNLYAVCDGHGGPDTAKFISIQLADTIEKSVKSKAFSYEKAKQIIENAFGQTEKVLQKQNLPDGSTVCLAFVCSDGKKRKVVTAHLGDARALIIRSDGKSRELTKDHKPTMRSEFERIHDVFGRLSKDNRVDGLLAVARAMGDFKVFGVGREPEVNEFDIDENDKFLVVGCDGVFDVLSNDDVAAVAFNAPSPVDAAFAVRNAAFGSGSTDNISVIAVDLCYK